MDNIGEIRRSGRAPPHYGDLVISQGEEGR